MGKGLFWYSLVKKCIVAADKGRVDVKLKQKALVAFGKDGTCRGGQ